MIEPIIKSLLDTDFYKLTMGQLVFLLHKDVPVRYAFANRTKSVKLPEFIDINELHRELDHVRSLRFTDEELSYLAGLKRSNDEPIFCEEYLEFLRNLTLPQFELCVSDGEFSIVFPGKWSEAIYWETIALPIVNELYYRGVMKREGLNIESVYEEGRKRLKQKTEILKEHPEIIFREFGTRRRFSGIWQREVVQTLNHVLSGQYAGTSNVKIAMDFGDELNGTLAHEPFMVYSAIYHRSDKEIRESHNRVLRDWWDLYGEDLSIALTDTFGSEFFFEDMTEEQARKWRGLRHDSGDPIEFGEKAIAFYEGYAIDPREKILVFSDGLTLEKELEIEEHFHGRIGVMFGWGTNLTNDLGFVPLSLVIKAVWAQGHDTCKLSDNLAKALGPPNVVTRFKRIFCHTNTFEEKLVY